MPFYHVGCQPLGERLSTHFPRCYIQDNLLLFFYRCFDLVTIQDKEHFHCSVTNTLVAIYKRVVLDEGEAQR